MTTSTLQFGSEIASELRINTNADSYIAGKIASLQDLLDALREQSEADSAMLRSTAAKLAQFFKQEAADIPLDIVSQNRDTFRDHLRSIKHKKNAVRTYSHYVNVLLARGTELGWQAKPITLPQEWMPLLESAQSAGCKKLIYFLTKKGLSPETVQESDLAEWTYLQIKLGGSYPKTRCHVSQLRRILANAGFGANLNLKHAFKNNYAIPLEMMPSVLIKEINEVLRWKQDRFVPSRPKDAQIRPITAALLRSMFCRIYGFALKVEGITTIKCMNDLITEQIITGFIAWNLNERGVKGETALTYLGGVHAALTHNPKFSHITGKWMAALLASIPDDDQGAKRIRKEEKYLPYSTLLEIPDKIRKDRARIPADDLKAVALSFRDELIIRWLLALPWRQRNLRECRIGGPNPNLFRASVSKTASITKPDWLVLAEQQKDVIEVWQVRFAPSETKTNHDVHFVLPIRLVPVLEEYLHVHRPALVGSKDPEVLFVNEVGNALDITMVRSIISRTALKYAGKIVTPHLFRDIFAYNWLELAPEDYLTLSKILWHRNINTTINIYGRRFNESTALCRMERLLPG